jgi:hypothetical protein
MLLVLVRNLATSLQQDGERNQRGDGAADSEKSSLHVHLQRAQGVRRAFFAPTYLSGRALAPRGLGGTRIVILVEAGGSDACTTDLGVSPATADAHACATALPSRLVKDSDDDQATP